MTLASAYVEGIASWRRVFSSPEAVRKYQERKLRQLISHAWRNVPYYRRLFDESGLHPGAIRGLGDLARILMSAKQHLQAKPLEERLARGIRLDDCAVIETSGSSGEPMKVARTSAEQLLLFGRRLRAHSFSGLRPWHRRFGFGLNPRRLAAHRLGLWRLLYVPLDVSPEEALRRMEEWRPHAVRGPSGFLEALIQQEPETVSRLGVQWVFTGAEHLSRRSRQVIEQAFGCPVIDFYGAVECNLIAWECRRCGLYHTCDDSVIVEVLRDGRPAQPGEDGEVIVTALHSYAMPFIRYRLGDAVSVPRKQAPCPIGFAAIEKVQGRTVDYLRFTGARTLSPYVLMDELEALEEIQRYEVRQTTPESITVLYRPAPGADGSRAAKRVSEQCRRVLPADVRVETAAVERFDENPAGKRRYVRVDYEHGA